MAKTKHIHAKGKKRINRSLWGDIIVFLLLLVVALFMALPFVYTVIQAFKPFEELFAFPPKFYVVNPTIDNFIDLFMVTANSWVPFSSTVPVYSRVCIICWVFSYPQITFPFTIWHFCVENIASIWTNSS